MINLADAAVRRDPFAMFARLRAQAPVACVRVGRRTIWVVTRHAECAALFKDTRFVKDQAKLSGGTLPWMPWFARPLARNMLDVDDPDHRRLRALVQQAFTARLIEARRGRVEALAHDLLDRAERRGGCDLMRDYAAPIPTTIIAELLGVPLRDRARFQSWTGRIVAADTSPVALLRALPAIRSFVRYLRRLIAAKRADPADDLLSALAAAAQDGDRLSEDELLAMGFLLLVAGHETTLNLIGNGALALIGDRSQRAALASDAGLRRTAVEELLRFDGPLLLSTERYAPEAVEFAGVTIPAGATIHAALASANRDPDAFADPDRLDLARAPNRHLAFGDGAHFCAGAALARLEAQVAIGTLVERFPDLALATRRQLAWKRGTVLRGLVALPVRLR